MHIYLVLVVSSLVVSVLSNIDKKNYLAHYLLACSICISIASLRFETGPDFFNYSNIFNNIKSGIESNYLNRLEPLYVLINILVIKINGNINTVFFFCSTIVFLNYFFAFKELKLNSIFLIFLYICLLYFPNILNLVRHGVAVSFVFLAFAKSICNKKLEALREESTLQEIAVKHGVHPNQISQWKSQAIAGMAELFERPNRKSQEVRQQEEKESEYLKTIGKQKVEIDFLKKKYRKLYGEEPPEWIQ